MDLQIGVCLQPLLQERQMLEQCKNMLPPPVFSQAGGYNSSAINLSLSSPDSNITIYYTINGDEPNNSSTVYSGPINITNTTVVKAIAYSADPFVPIVLLITTPSL